MSRVVPNTPCPEAWFYHRTRPGNLALMSVFSEVLRRPASTALFEMQALKGGATTKRMRVLLQALKGICKKPAGGTHPKSDWISLYNQESNKKKAVLFHLCAPVLNLQSAWEASITKDTGQGGYDNSKWKVIIMMPCSKSNEIISNGSYKENSTKTLRLFKSFLISRILWLT